MPCECGVSLRGVAARPGYWSSQASAPSASRVSDRPDEAPHRDEVLRPTVALAGAGLDLPRVPGADEVVTVEPAVREPSAVVRAAVCERVRASVAEHDHSDCLIAIARRDHVTRPGVLQRILKTRTIVERVVPDEVDNERGRRNHGPTLRPPSDRAFLPPWPTRDIVGSTVACVLVHIEVEGDRPTDHARAVLGEGRRIASSLGASLHAVAVIGEKDEVPMGHKLIESIGQAGADRVVLVAAEKPSPSMWSTVGAALVTATEQVQPSLILLASTAGGRDIAPRLAAHLGGAYFAEPAVEAGPRGEVVLSRTVYGGDLWRRVSLDELDVVAVATLDDRRGAAKGDDEAEVVQLEGTSPPDARVEIIGATEDDGAALERARVIVVAGAGTTAESMVVVTKLAKALGAELGGTRTLCQRGLLPAGREIGVGGRHVAPDLYVVCGASGSVAHLGAVSSDAEIVAIDRDPAAQIFKNARWGLVGTIEDLVPKLIEALAPKPAAPDAKEPVS